MNKIAIFQHSLNLCDASNRLKKAILEDTAPGYIREQLSVILHNAQQLEVTMNGCPITEAIMDIDDHLLQLTIDAARCDNSDHQLYLKGKRAGLVASLALKSK